MTRTARPAPTHVQNPLPRATALETAQVLRDVQAPMIAKGPIIRRPRVVGVIERFGLEGRAVARMQALSDRYGSGPLMLAVPGRDIALVLDPEHVHRVLAETPEPFAPGEMLKRNALKHFEPEVALVSHGTERAQRRRLNEQVLDDGHPVHRMAGDFLPVVEQEAVALLETADRAGSVLAWDEFKAAWYRVVRRVVLGDSAADDTELTDLMEKLRADGNWAFFKPVDTRARAELHSRLQAALDRAEPGSLAAFMARADAGPDDSPINQIPQWLFAFDPAGMATFRALALLAAHPERMAQARREVAARASESVSEQATGQASGPSGGAAGRAAGSSGTAPLKPLGLLRATVLESLRLWATTPMLLRQTTREVGFDHGVLPAGATVLIFAPFFHRDDRHVEVAHRFAPELWDPDRTAEAGAPVGWPLVPFSAGPGICPGRHLVLLLTSSFLARLIGDREIAVASHRLDPEHLPSLLSNFALEFRLS
ncbi:cytochrome P450 [Sediminivirga luteola]|uniref:cytochrome P450 n=1 Tax=Sediminivirga luteola TaxID=1774748 RepID=UPI001F57644A|nr:cytochrome P450 [Sediminivirga luteola]MCI2267013.1 cytochrome P450 [Sediminivirga luteola]